MAHNFKDKNIGVGITGSYCTYKKVFEELRRLADTQANLFTIFSDNASSTDSRFGKCKDFLKLAEEISGTYRSKIYARPSYYCTVYRKYPV